MLKWMKRAALALGVVVVAGLIAGVIWREELVRLYSVNTLFDEDKIVANFSNMRGSFLHTEFARDGEVFEFGRAERPLPETFESAGTAQSTAEYLARSSTTSLLVVRDDAIEHESYFLSTGEEDLRISWSIAKSVLSALVGIALADGAIASLDDPVVKYAPALAGSAYDGATLRNVLNMASGVAFNEDYLDYDSDINKMGRALALGGSLDEFSAALAARVDDPGVAWRYVSIDTHVVAMVLRGATGQPVATYLEDRIWSRIGTEADGYYLTDGEGAAFVLGGLNLRTRDYARFARLILNDGMWNGARILPEGWVAESTSATAPPAADEGQAFGYGYQWWIPPGANGEIMARGVYGQYLWIDQNAGVIIVKTSADRKFREGDGAAHRDAMAFFRAVARR
ncbi:MAG: serine hydrolase [Pseudomonadota bacterium]